MRHLLPWNPRALVADVGSAAPNDRLGGTRMRVGSSVIDGFVVHLLGDGAW